MLYTKTKNMEDQKFDPSSIPHIVSDPIFIKNVKSNIAKIYDQRYKRPRAKTGFHYKRNWYDRMEPEGKLNLEYFIENIPAIWAKSSTLPSEIRGVIEYFCNMSLNETLLEYENMKPKIVKS